MVCGKGIICGQNYPAILNKPTLQVRHMGRQAKNFTLTTALQTRRVCVHQDKPLYFTHFNRIAKPIPHYNQ